MGWIGSAIIVLVGSLLYLTNRFPNLRISHFSHKRDTKAPAMAATEPSPQSTRLQTPPTPPTRPMRITVAMTGATGAILGIRLLERLREMNVETHLVISRWAVETIKYETKYTANDVRALATRCYPVNDAAAAISSGSFQADGMIIVPCSMRTLSAVRTGFADDLICRAADVTLKERRKLVLVVRETPLSGIHLENMLDLTRYGAVIFPPMPAFYTMPESVDDIVTQSVGRMLDMFGLDAGNFERWDGF
ncbi:hypothetical protein BDV24DRAFT_165583 [Aspergillus arachidicola]|uniref:Flavin prenyltransferase PAD1, mitochondrial n=1 Tax=Aspergillus arachidicola TaxID=656916 RepID=A0A2G7G442_9EURO|nr:hypothetical protein BDV24DRAFT_165583 [Aspergillus arachidicola]PIG87604.1 phenylacrylic acid decarboxylase [Aspergillus arachidicola]